MEIKLFGKSLFEAKRAGGIAIYNTAIDHIKKSDYLPDFYRDVGSSLESSSYGLVVREISDGVITSTGKKTSPIKKGASISPKPKVELTPKGIYKLQMLNDKSFQMKADPVYIDQQIEQFRDKLGMIKMQEFDMNRGTIEISSILTRFENRKKYPQFKEYFEEFPYTTSTKILQLTKEHDYLRLGEVAQFLADMPQEAVDVMKKYTAKTKELCEKKPVYYIIANKKDFQKSEKRRDPILLAQSPFGHFWQILGAWDEEMLLVDEL